MAIGDVLDRWRLNNGWNPWDDDSHHAASLSFVRSLDREGVPPAAYGELYERALELRVRHLNQGKDFPLFGVELMLACWPGLRDDIRQREIDAGRTLTNYAASQCPRCFGTGIETFFDQQGNAIGSKPGCDHQAKEGK